VLVLFLYFSCVSLDCPFMIAPSVFSNIHLQFHIAVFCFYCSLYVIYRG
jgi:hypothetical protein